MISVPTTILIIAGLLVLVSLLQPVADRLRLPYTVLLAIVGVAVGGLASFLLYTPLTTSFDGVVAPLVNLPFNSSVFLFVFLPLLVFHAAISIDIRELVRDAAPILTLAIVAVVVATLAIGFGVAKLGHTALIPALLLGSIVATTDPAAVVAIFRDVGAPGRLVRLVEGEALLNDAAAIVLFEVLLGLLTNGAPIDLASSLLHFAISFGGGILLGVIGGRLFGFLVPFIRGEGLAEVTLSLALPYLVYVLGEEVFRVSGIVAVVAAALTVGVVGSTKMTSGNWHYLQRIWDQIGFWSGSLIFISASILVPKLMAGGNPHDLVLLAIALVTGLAARAAVLFGILPILSLLRLSQKVTATYKIAIAWGGLRGAVTLALALAVTEDGRLSADVQHLVAGVATGFVLFTLLVNGITLRPVVRLLKLDRLSPLNLALRGKVLSLSLAHTEETITEATRNYGIDPAIVETVIAPYRRKVEEITATPDLDASISDRDRIRIGLVALANQEIGLVHDHQAQGTVSPAVIERMLRQARDLADGARTDGRTGYNRVLREYLSFTLGFRIAHALHLRFGLARPLQQRLTARFEALMLLRVILDQLRRFNSERLSSMLGQRVADILDEVLAQRLTSILRGLEALRLQYPDHADSLLKRFLRQFALRIARDQYEELFEQGLIGAELYDNLVREHHVQRQSNEAAMPLDLGLRTQDMLRQVSLFENFNDADLAALARLFRSRLALPDEKILRRGEKATAMYFISSGAVEVVFPHQRRRLGRGDFFGEIPLLLHSALKVDVIALGYCQLLALHAWDFQRFLKTYPAAKEAIDQAFETRKGLIEELL